MKGIMLFFTFCYSFFALSQVDGNGLSDNVKWMYDESKWGISHHYLAGGALNNAYFNIQDYDQWNHYIKNFDVERYSKQLENLGVGYVIFTITQNRGYLCTKSTVYDLNAPPCPGNSVGCKNQPGTNRADYTPERDLLGDIAKSLKKRGIKTIAYLPTHVPNRWTGRLASSVFPDWYVSDFISELANRWGDDIAGWWFDGWYELNVNSERANNFPVTTKMWNAINGGNPNSIVSFSNGWSSSYAVAEKFSHFTQGEANSLPKLPTNRVSTGWNGNKAQYHGFTFLSKHDPVFAGWGQIKRNLKYSDKTVSDHTFKAREGGGISTWDVSINPNGKFTLDRLKQVQAIGNRMSTTADTRYSSLTLINNTSSNIVYSGNWNLSSNRGTGAYNQDVHYTTTNGDFFSYSFFGKSIVFATSKSSDQGDVEVFIDDVSQGIFSTKDLYKRQVQNIIFEKHNLTEGNHILKVVKRSGEYLLVDLIGYSNSVILSVEEIKIKESEKIYPTALSKSNILFLETRSSSQIKIYNLLGIEEENFSVSWTGNKAKIDLSRFSKGIYFLKTKSNVFKILKN